MRRVALAVSLALGIGCAHAVHPESPPRVEHVRVGSAQFTVSYWPGDEGSARRVMEALEVAVPRAERWGALRQTVAVTIRPTHEALETAVRRDGYDWLKAWARYAEIEIQSPDTWSPLGTWFGPSDRDVLELVTHELTHCAMYQRAATELDWPYKGIPLWFREGLASVTADQGHRRGAIEDLWRDYERSAAAERGAPDAGDPVADAESIYKDQDKVVYRAAHHAFRFLVARYGEERVAAVLERMSRGRTFGRAFEEEIGITEGEFTSEFRRYVLWQGWRR